MSKLSEGNTSVITKGEVVYRDRGEGEGDDNVLQLACMLVRYSSVMSYAWERPLCVMLICHEYPISFCTK